MGAASPEKGGRQGEVKLPVHAAAQFCYFSLPNCFLNPRQKVFEIISIIILDVRRAFGFPEKNRLTARKLREQVGV